MYWLKILLSQLMLLPTLYVEIRDQKGISENLFRGSPT